MKWYESTQETILSPLAVKSMPSMPFAPVVKDVVWRFFDYDVHNRDHMIAAFNRHNDAVRKAIPNERLLVFDAKDGWAPLCAFLGRKVPADPFPRVNSKEDMRPMLEAMAARFSEGLEGEDLERLSAELRAKVHGRKP